MLVEKPKKCSGVKFLKVEQDFFRNPKRLSSKAPSINDFSINNNSPSIKAKYIKSFLNDYKINQNPLKNSSIINTKFKKYNSFNKFDFFSPKELSLFKNSIKSKKDIEIPLSKFDNINKQIKFLNKKSASTRNLLNFRNNLSKKSLFFNTNNSNSISNKNNVIKIGKKKNINHCKKNNHKNHKINIKKQIEENYDIYVKGKNNNSNYTNNNTNLIKIISSETNMDNVNKESKKSKLKTIFCCL